MESTQNVWPTLSVLLVLVVSVLEGCYRDEPSSSPAPSSTESKKRLGSFLVVGDWGWDSDVHGNLQSRACQQAIADRMAEKIHELGDVKFIINVGDSFYPGGVANKSDQKWDDAWRNVYSSGLRSLPWYSVYGNHDYHNDPCACSTKAEDCAQISTQPNTLDFFYMPDFSWFKAHPELDTEVIALDTNYYMWWNYTCQYSLCPEMCAANLKERADLAFQLFYERVATSRASNLIVFSHYPTDYFPGAWNESERAWAPSWVYMDTEMLPRGFSDFLSELSNASRGHIEYFGGHRHSVDQSTVASTAPHSNWLVGGGGGWGTDGPQQGFVVGEIMSVGKIATYSVIVDPIICNCSAEFTR